MNDYIEELKSLLTQLAAEERSDVVDFYTEYLQDGHFKTYNDCVKELGTPHQLARKVLADYSIKNLNTASRSGNRTSHPRDDVKTIWLMVLAVLSTPITIPLALGAIGLFIGVVAVAISVLLAVLGVGFGVVFGGLVSFATGISVVGSDFWVGMFYSGIGLVAIGAVIVLIPTFKSLFDGTIHGITLFSKWLYDKLVTRNRAEKHERGQRK